MSRPRIDVYRIQELVRLHRMGEDRTKAARSVGVSPTTERAYRKVLQEAGLLDGDPSTLPTEEELRAVLGARLGEACPPQQTSSITGWEDEVVELVKKGNTARAIHSSLSEKAQKEGREFGSYDAVKRMVRRLRRALKPDADEVSIPVWTKPGEVAQVDFGYVGRVLDPESGKARRAWLFVMVLAYSRHMFAKVVFDQKSETWQRLHVEAFEAFGGAVDTVVPDNLKSAVVRAAFGRGEQQPELNRSYCELARHYGFKIDPTPPRAPNKKGRVESAVKYAKSNFVKPRAEELATTPIDRLNEELATWVAETAGLREHGTTKRQPRVVFDEEERPALTPLPREPYEVAVWERPRVLRDSHVRVQGAYYSVPHEHLGTRVEVRVTARSVVAYVEGSRIATHARVAPGRWSTAEAHLPPERAPYRHRSEGHWRERAAAIGEETGRWVDELLEGDGVRSRLPEAQRAVLLLEDVAVERAEAACRRASHYENYSVKALRTILEQGLEAQPLGETARDGEQDEALEGGEVGDETPPRFARSAAEVQALCRWRRGVDSEETQRGAVAAGGER